MSSAPKNHYERLGVKPDSTDAELGIAYRWQVTVSHRHAVHRIVGHIAELKEAYRALRDREVRRHYDAGLREQRQRDAPVAEPGHGSPTRREAAMRRAIRERMARDSERCAIEARAQNAFRLGVLVDEHDRRQIADARARGRRELAQRATKRFFLVLLLAAGALVAWRLAEGYGEQKRGSEGSDRAEGAR